VNDNVPVQQCPSELEERESDELVRYSIDQTKIVSLVVAYPYFELDRGVVELDRLSEKGSTNGGFYREEASDGVSHEQISRTKQKGCKVSPSPTIDPNTAIGHFHCDALQDKDLLRWVASCPSSCAACVEVYVELALARNSP